MEIVRSKRAAKRQTRRAAAQGEGSTTERRRSSPAQTSRYRTRSSSTQTSYEYRARGGAHEEEAEEKQHWQQRGNGPEPSLPNVASLFARLTNAILKRIEEEGTRDKLYDEFMKNCKRKFIYDLKSTYMDLDYFYTDPSYMMPSCLSNSPPATNLYTDEMDMRLSSKGMQIRQDLLAFVEELGFVSLNVSYVGVYRPFFVVRVRLDVATVPTTEAQTNVENRLLALEIFSSKP